MVGRRLGKACRWTGFAVTAIGVGLVIVALYGIAMTGDVRHQMVSVFMALPGGLLVLLAGLDVLSRSTRTSRAWPGVSFEEWLGTAQSRRDAAKAAFN